VKRQRRTEHLPCHQGSDSSSQRQPFVVVRAEVDAGVLEVAKRSGVSPSRISKIQRTIEIAKPPVVLRQLLDKCNVKN
jgi:hypothetical protein